MHFLSISREKLGDMQVTVIGRASTRHFDKGSTIQFWSSWSAACHLRKTGMLEWCPKGLDDGEEIEKRINLAS
jgi:hypothetical protein